MKRRTSLVLASLAISGFAAILLYAFVQLVSFQRSMDIKMGENMLWLMSQAEREGRRLHESFLEFSAGEESYDELMLRLDIFYSRMGLLTTDTPQARWFESTGLAPMLYQAEDRLDNLAAVLEAPAPDGSIDLGTARDHLLPILKDLGSLTNATMTRDRQEKQLQQARISETLYLITVAFFGLVLTGLLISIQLLLSIRAARKSLEELEQHRAGLERIVAARTAELNAALATERSTKEAYRSFISTVSHQFRTPLSIIDVVAQRLIRRSEDFSSEMIVEKARRIRSSTQRLSELVTSVTNAARLDENHLVLSLACNDLNSIVRRAHEFHAEMMPQREITLELTGDLSCQCDAALIEQVVLNLLSNAVKYSPVGTEITIRTWQRGESVCCEVFDRGIGIPAEDQPRIFERFFRARNVSSNVGSGLGLALSRTIVELHGGYLAFNSMLGEGTVAGFCLPVIVEEPVGHEQIGTGKQAA